jgi:hypothetical protein
MNPLLPGDVLSYSSGTLNGDPRGFRRVREDRNLLGVCGQRWPVLLEAIGQRAPLVINAYPAYLGRFEFGILVDTYLSPKTTSRALRLAVLEQRTAILIGQPLFVADLLWRYANEGFELPGTLILAVAGYLMPHSLQSAIETLCSERGCRAHVVHFYGAAEVDASCLVAKDRDEAGNLVYHPTGSEVGLSIGGSELVLSLSTGSGETIIDRFATGDSARAEGEGYVIWNHDRANPRVVSRLESWGIEEWRRRTGYLVDGASPLHQLREGAEPRGADELAFFEFAGRFGFSWLEKPDWTGMRASVAHRASA